MTQNENIASEAKQDEILASILQRLTPASAPPPPPQGASGGGDVLSSLLSNPEIIGKLPGLLSSIKPVLEMLMTSAGTSAPASMPQGEAVQVSALPEDTPTLAVKRSPGAESRTALLCAMKPYLSRDRQNAIDYIVKIGRLGDILKTL